MYPNPNGAVDAVLTCITAFYAEPGGVGVPALVLLGGDGTKDGYTCCEGGLLAVEWSRVDRSSQSDRGGQGCDDVYRVALTVTVLRCSQLFSQNGPGKSTDGGSPPENIRNAESLAVSQEGWALFNALSCCANNPDDWREHNVTVDGISINKNGACWHVEITLAADVAVCC